MVWQIRSLLSVTLIFAVFSQLSRAENWEFSTIQQISPLNGSTFASSIAVDPFDQSFYIYGQFSSSQLFLAKFLFDGTLSWQSVFGNQSFVQTGYIAGSFSVNRPAIDARTGDVFVHGWTTGSFGGQMMKPRLGGWAQTSNLYAYVYPYYYYTYQWSAIAWSPTLGRFLVVCNYVGSGNYPVLSSTNGVTWVLYTTSINRPFTSVVWASSLFVAVSSDGYVMTTTTGINGFTLVTPPVQNAWQSVTWSAELGLLVAVANTGAANRVMTSSNGVNWLMRASAADYDWRSVCWSPEVGRFVAVASSGVLLRVMTSENGADWSSRSAAADNNWQSVVWAKQLGLFVAVASSGTGNRVMTSPDGITWTIRNSAADSPWKSITYSPENGVLLAIANTGNQIMVSPDGINWAVRSLGNGNTFSGVTYSPSLNTFVAVGFNPVSGNVEGGYTMTMSVSALTDTPFVARFNSSGSLVATKFYETSPGRPAGMEIIGNQLYLAGTIVVGAAPDYDGYLMAMNADDFSTQWIVQMTAGTTTDIISAMDIDQANGVIFLTGLTNGALDGQTNKGGGDALISRRNLANGTLISTLQIGSSANDQGNNIVLDPYRPVVYVAGNAGGTINSVPLMYNAQDQWISAYTANNLTHLWTKIVGGSGTIENAFDVSVHPLTQNIYLSGAISALISGVPNVQPIYSGARDLTVAVFRPNGTFVWLKVAGSTADDFAYGSAFTDNGALLIAAQFNGTSGLLIYGADANSSYVPPANPFARPGIPVTSQVCYSTLATVLATQSQCTATSTVSATLTSTQRLTSTLTLLACTSTQTLILRETTCTATQFVTATVSQTAPVTVSQCAQLVTQSVIANAVSTVTITQAASLLSCSTQQTILVNGQIAQPNSEALKTVTATETVFVTSVAGKSDNNDISNYSSVDTMIIAVGVGFSVLLIAIVSFFVYQKNWNSKIGKMTSRYPAYSTRENFFGGYSAMKEDVNAMGRISRDFERPFLKLNSAVEREVDETGVVDNTQKLQFFEDTQKNNIVTDVQVNGPKSQAYLETKTV